MDELAVALKLDPLELRLRCYSDRDQHDDRPYSSKALRECYRQGADGVRLGQAQPRSRARCATAASSSAGAWRRASGRRCRCRSRCASCSPPTAMPRLRARPPTSAPAPTPSWRRSRPTCSACRSTTSASSSATRACRNRRSKADRGLRPRCRTGSRRRPKRFATSCCAWPGGCRIRRSRTPRRMRSRLSDGKLVSRRDASRAVSIADAMRHGARGPHRAGEDDQSRP